MSGTYRAEGVALSAQPDFLVSGEFLTFVSTDPADTGVVYLEAVLADYTVQPVWTRLNGVVPVQSAIKILRVNKCTYNGGGINSVTAGVVTVSYEGTVLSTILAGDQGAWDCRYSIGPALAGAVLANVTPGVTTMHRLWQSPWTVRALVEGEAPPLGDLWAEGVGDRVQFELKK